MFGWRMRCCSFAHIGGATARTDGCPPAYADTGTENVIKIDEGCIARYTLHFLFGSIPCFTSFEHLVGAHRRADEIGRINFQCIRNIEEHIQREVVCRDGQGRLLVVHCAAGAGGVTLSRSDGFTQAARPGWYGEE